jgi:hypothetical protein
MNELRAQRSSNGEIQRHCESDHGDDFRPDNHGQHASITVQVDVNVVVLHGGSPEVKQITAGSATFSGGEAVNPRLRPGIVCLPKNVQDACRNVGIFRTGPGDFGSSEASVVNSRAYIHFRLTSKSELDFAVNGG